MTGSDFDPSAPGAELLGATIVSGRSFWDFSDSGHLVQTHEFPADITSADSRRVVAGGALYHPHYDPGCQ